jgi:DNA-binding MarR family transcriptional regulator
MTGQRTREETLRAALREAVRGSEASAEAPPLRPADRERGRRRWLGNLQRAEGAQFVRGIIDTAALIQQAHDASGEPVFRTDAQYKLLGALELIGGWPSISELARAMRVSKQATREQVIAAGRSRLLELLPDPRDRRSIQIGLTPSGKKELTAARLRELTLITMLLGGLGARDMRLVAHVLRVMRARLLRAERERAHAEREPAGAERERPHGAERASLGRRSRG